MDLAWRGDQNLRTLTSSAAEKGKQKLDIDKKKQNKKITHQNLKEMKMGRRKV